MCSVASGQSGGARSVTSGRAHAAGGHHRPFPRVHRRRPEPARPFPSL